MRRLVVPALMCAAALVWLTSTPVRAQTAPSGGAASRASQLPRELGKPEDDLQLDVAAYQVDGLPALAPQVVASLTAPYVGKARHYEDLIAAVTAVSRYMQREMGYYAGFAYLPEQSLQDGVVHIVALEGRLDQIRLNWPEGIPVRREVVEQHLAALKPGSVLRVDEIERVVFLVNDLKGVRVRFEIEEGREPGTASLVATAQPEARWSAQAEGDSLGSHYTGTGRASLRGSWASPLGLGDALSAQVLQSLSGGQALGAVSYVLPVGVSGLKLGAGFARVHYEVDPDAVDEDLHGNVRSASAFALYPLVRSRNLNLFGLLHYEDKHFDDAQGTSTARKRSRDLQASLLGDFRDTLAGGAINTYELGWLQGRMAFDPADTPPGTPAAFGKWTLAASRLQRAGAHFQWYARIKTQWATSNLDVTERLALGGVDGVRAYGPGEAAGDTAQLASAELRWLPPQSWLGRWAPETVFSLFYDWGHARRWHDLSAQPDGTDNDITLSGYGVGVVWERPDDLALRLHLAWRGSGQPVDERRAHQPRAQAVLTKHF